jgi:hypothetical protein
MSLVMSLAPPLVVTATTLGLLAREIFAFFGKASEPKQASPNARDDGDDDDDKGRDVQQNASEQDADNVLTAPKLSKGDIDNDDRQRYMSGLDDDYDYPQDADYRERDEKGDAAGIEEPRNGYGTYPYVTDNKFSDTENMSEKPDGQSREDIFFPNNGSGRT